MRCLNRIYCTIIVLLCLVTFVIPILLSCTGTAIRDKKGRAYVPPNEIDVGNGEATDDSDTSLPGDNGDTAGDSSNSEPPTGSGGDDSQQVNDWISTLTGHLEILIMVSPDSTFANAHPYYREDHGLTAVDDLWQFGWVEIEVDVPFRRINLLARRNYMRYIRYDETSNPLYIIPYWQRELVEDFPAISKDQIITLLDWIQRNGMNWHDPDSPFRVNPFGTVPTDYPYAGLLIRYYPSSIGEEIISEYVFAHTVDTYEDFMVDPLIRGSSMLLNSFDCYFGDFANMPWEGFIGYYDPEKL